jgi:hypothetical protein
MRRGELEGLGQRIKRSLPRAFASASVALRIEEVDRPRKGRSARTLCAGVLAAALATGLAIVGACGGGSAGAPSAAVASTVEGEALFAPIRAQWAAAGPAERAALRPRLTDIVAELGRRNDGLEPLARAYLAIAWLDAGVPNAADAVSRPLVDGPTGNAHDLGLLVHGAALRRTGQAQKALAVLEPLAGKLLDPFARPLLYEELTEAALAQQAWDDALIYAEAWLRATPGEDHLAARAAVAKALARIPDTVASSVLESARRNPGLAGHSEEMLALLRERLESEASDETLAAIADGGVDDAALAPTTGTMPSFDEGPPHFSPKALAVLVPTSSSVHGELAAAVARASQLTLDPLPDDEAPAGGAAAKLDAGGADARVASAPRTHHRLMVFDTAGSALGVARALETAERAGAAVVIGGLTQAESDALANAAQARKIPALLLRAPTFARPADATWWSLGPSEAEEIATTLGASSSAPRVIVHADRAPDDADAREGLSVGCSDAPKSAGAPTYPVSLWRAKKVAAILVLGDARCALKVAREVEREPGGAKGWPLRWVLAPSAVEAVVERSSFARTALGAGVVPASEEAPPALRKLWLDQAGPVGFAAALAHDAVTLATIATPGDLPSTQDVLTIARARETTRARLASAKGDLWTTTASGLRDGALPRAFRATDLAAGDALRPSWLKNR